MKFENPIPVKQIAEWTKSIIVGDDSREATGINEIHKVEHGDITFVDLEKYYDRSFNSPASIVITDKMIPERDDKTILVNTQPFEAYNSIVNRFRQFVPSTVAIDPSADIHPSVILEPNVVIAKNVKIGANCIIMANSYIGPYTEIGENVVVKPNAIIGSDAFYFKRYPTHHAKWTTCGRVLIGNDVYIGAGCTFDRGVSGDTIVGDGCKFDNQVHIGHGAVFGKHCLCAAQVGIGGKTIIGDHVTIYGQCGLAQNLVIGNNVTIFAKSGVSKNISDGKIVFGYPAEEVKDKFKQLALLRRLSKEDDIKIER